MLGEEVKIALLSTMIIVTTLPLIGWLQGIVITLCSRVLVNFVPAWMIYFILIWVSFPGVIFHELCHATATVLTGGVLGKITLFKPETNGTLGSVQWAPRGGPILQSIQCSLVSSAPTFLGSIAIYILFTSLLPTLVVTWQIVLVWYLIVCIALHLDMSTADFLIYLKGIPVCILIVFIICTVTKVNFIPLVQMFI